MLRTDCEGPDVCLVTGDFEFQTLVPARLSGVDVRTDADNELVDEPSGQEGEGAHWPDSPSRDPEPNRTVGGGTGSIRDSAGGGGGGGSGSSRSSSGAAASDSPDTPEQREAFSREGEMSSALGLIETLVCRVAYVPGVNDPASVRRLAPRPPHLTPQSINVHGQLLELCPGLWVTGFLPGIHRAVDFVGHAIDRVHTSQESSEARGEAAMLPLLLVLTSGTTTLTIPEVLPSSHPFFFPMRPKACSSSPMHRSFYIHNIL